MKTKEVSVPVTTSVPLDLNQMLEALIRETVHAEFKAIFGGSKGTGSGLNNVQPFQNLTKTQTRVKRAAKAGAASSGELVATPIYDKGTIVNFKQGRGTFQGVVQGVGDDGQFLITRTTDGKEFQRTADTLNI